MRRRRWRLNRAGMRACLIDDDAGSEVAVIAVTLPGDGER